MKNKAAAGREPEYWSKWDQLYDDNEYELRDSYTFLPKIVFMRLHIRLIKGKVRGALCLHGSTKRRG